MGSYAELFEQCRKVALDAIADAVENYHDHKSAVEKAAPAPPIQAPEQGDFLYDLLRLNVQYVNQLARLGSSYSIIASRALERFYGKYGAKNDTTDASPEVIKLKGRLGQRVTTTLKVKNPLTRGADVTIRCRDFKPDADLFVDLQYGALKSRRRKDELTLSLGASESAEVKLTLKVPGRNPDPKGVTPTSYEGAIEIEAQESSSIKRTVEMRVVVQVTNLRPDDGAGDERNTL